MPELPFDIASIVLFNSAGGMSGFRYSDVPAVFHPLMAHVQYFVLNKKFFHGSLVYGVLAQRSTSRKDSLQTIGNGNEQCQEQKRKRGSKDKMGNKRNIPAI